MKLVMTLLVRDEEDILEWILRYHLSRGVDHFVVTDNLSIDRTPDILHQFEREGVVTYIHESADDYSQDLWVTRMTEFAQSELRPDWILHSDADEFWWPDDHPDLKQAFSAVPPDVRVVKVDRQNFLGPAEDTGTTFFSRMIFRQLVSKSSLGEPLPPKVAHRPLWSPYVHQGNHRVSEDGEVLSATELCGVSLLHFPARSPAQFRNKIAKGGAAYVRNTRLDRRTGATWRSLHDDLLAGRFDRVLKAHFMAEFPGSDEEHLVEDHRLRDYLTDLQCQEGI